MPRASTDTSEESPKRAPRKRAVRRVVTKSETPIRKARAPRTARVNVEETPTFTSAATSPRRAPTHLTASGKGGTTKRYAMVLAALFLMLGSAAWIGFSDVGQIDVTARINEQNQKKSLTNEETSATGESMTVPVQNTPPAAISNLRPSTATPPIETPAPEVASSTEETASSTDTVVEGDGADEASVEEGDPADQTDGTTPELVQ